MHCNGIQQMKEKTVSPACAPLGMFPQISHSVCLRCCSERTAGDYSLLKVVLVPNLPRVFPRYSRMESFDELGKCYFLALFGLYFLCSPAVSCPRSLSRVLSPSSVLISNPYCAAQVLNRG